MNAESGRKALVWNIYELTNEMVGTPGPLEEFLLISLTTGALEQIPKNMDERRWLNNLDITFSYYIGDENQDEIANRLGISRQRVSAIVGRTIRQMWNRSSTDTQERYPLDEVTENLRRDLALYRYTQLSKVVNNGLIDGRSMHLMLADLGMDRQEYDRQRYLAKEKGVDLPSPTADIRLEPRLLATRIMESTESEDLLTLFEQVSLRFLTEHTKGEDPLLTKLSSLAPEGVKSIKGKNAQIVIAQLQAAGIATGIHEVEVAESKIQRYYFVKTVHAEEVRAIIGSLVEDGSISPAIERIAGPQVEQLPSTYQLQDRGIYSSLKPLLKGLSIKVGGRWTMYRIVDLFDDTCPITVFRVANGYVFRKEDELALVKYLKDRAGQLGIK